MREIKFRAWDKISKPNRMKTWGQLQAQYNNISQVFNSEGFELMQYTGLKDKHGKEIYEGDILTWQSLSSQDIECKGKVYYMNGSYWVKTKKNIAPYLGDMARYHNPEVIGNVFENPELLEG